MKKSTRFVGLDVPKDTIEVAEAETGGEVRYPVHESALSTDPAD